MIDGHGDDIYQYLGRIKYNFSSNVYYKGCHPLLLKELEKSLKKIQNYPSPRAAELSGLAAKHFNLSENNFLFTNGATEAFYLIAQHFYGKSATILAPTFAEYEDACTINKLTCRFISKDEIAGPYLTDLAFICNPNNPDGAVLKLPVLEGVLNDNPQTHFVIDEAYCEFAVGFQSALALLKKHKNLTIVRSLTKTFTIPGLRLGYMVSNNSFIAKMESLKMPWSVNSLAIASGRFIFDNYEALSFDVSDLLHEADVFKKAVNKIEYLAVEEGETTYFLVELKNEKKAADLKKYLVDKHQILIRDANNFKGLKGEFIRLSVQSELANTRLIKALKQWT